MSEPQSIEEVMKRIRAQLGANAPAKPPSAERATAGESSEKILERIKQRLQRPAPAGTLAAGAASGAASPDQPLFKLSLHDLWQLGKEIDTAREGSRLTGQLNPRNPGPINELIQFVKKVMKRSLTWYTRPLHLFQVSVIRALDQLRAIVDNHNESLRKMADEFVSQATAFEQKATGLDDKLSESVLALETKLKDATAKYEVRFAEATTAHQAGLGMALAPYSARIASITDELETLRLELRQTRVELREANTRGELETLRLELRQTRVELREANTRGRIRDRDMRRTLYALEKGEAAAEGHAPPPAPAMFRSEIKSDREFDYFAFEDLYRGDEDAIRQRQQEYLQYFCGRDNVVDIGCGRGEFLEVLRDNNISARGVELGLDQYLLCREKGLDVVQQDLFSFLESLPDESLGGLFSAQVIEHLTASDQLRYVALAYRKTRPGSPVIFETINAQCVYAVMRNFFLDPTHVRPVHPETLKFAMESMQFKDVELRFSAPVWDKQIPPLKLNGDTPQLAEFNRAVAELNKLIFGDQDYAAIGWR